METLEKCLPCDGVGQLTGWFDRQTNKPCPWCDSTGKATKKENETFLRVIKKVPVPSRACTAFGTFKP